MKTTKNILPKLQLFALGLGFLAIAVHCGGEPIGSKVPKANPAKVAGIAAGAAALATVADPDAAKRNQESRGGERGKKGKKVTETVPADVLDRSEKSDEEEREECTEEEAKQAESDAQKHDQKLFPEHAQPRRCKPKEAEEEPEKGNTKEETSP
jgi:hypothetical protein